MGPKKQLLKQCKYNMKAVISIRIISSSTIPGQQQKLGKYIVIYDFAPSLDLIF